MNVVQCTACCGRGWRHRLRVGTIPYCPPGRMLVVQLAYAAANAVKEPCTACCGTGRRLADERRKDRPEGKRR